MKKEYNQVNKSLRIVYLPKTATAVQDYAFFGFEGLEKVVFSDSVKSFGYGCSQYGLVLVTLPDENNTRLPKPPFRPKSGDLIHVQVKTKTPDSLPKDEKSGALIVKL